MKKYSKAVISLSALVLLLCILPQFAMAQVSDPDTPIDGGISILVAAGVGYGIKKARDRRKKNLHQLP